MSNQYYVCIASSKNKDPVRLCHGPCTKEQAIQAVQEINSRLAREPFAYKIKFPEENMERSTATIDINGEATEVPTGAIAYKHADPTEDARWVYENWDLVEIRAQDPGLLIMVDEAEPIPHKVIVNGKSVDFDTVVNLMDDDLRKHLHSTVADYDQDDPKSYQHFVNCYCEAHYQKFKEDFQVI